MTTVKTRKRGSSAGDGIVRPTSGGELEALDAVGLNERAKIELSHSGDGNSDGEPLNVPSAQALKEKTERPAAFRRKYPKK
ncbi:MAG: hypothetical protein GF416_05870 [Candidatus Altiarchaeales archaeon]|nr:hypothetical protein [Candidatus Altiarchaeales archaeon]MBD3416643.1 hypothetical protein [Candidatus Altiarchaeales archaeon]